MLRRGIGRGTLLALLAVITLQAGCRGGEPVGTPVSPEEAARLIVNRNWLDQLPDEEAGRKFNVLLLLPAFQNSGVHQYRTMWKGAFELFFFKVDGPKVTFDLRGSRQKITTGYRMERLETDSNQPFELKLIMDRSPRGPRTYYSFSSRRSESARLGRQLPPLGLSLGQSR